MLFSHTVNFGCRQQGMTESSCILASTAFKFKKRRQTAGFFCCLMISQTSSSLRLDLVFSCTIKKKEIFLKGGKNYD